MESPTTSSSLQSTLDRHLAHVKLISRLIGHELHAQTGARLALSREELNEMQTSLDLFIEEMARHRAGAPLTRVEPVPVPVSASGASRMN